jgi:predicted amidophosphoribosyltransferase
MTVEAFSLSIGKTVTLVYGGIHSAQGCTNDASYFTRARMKLMSNFEESHQAKLYHSQKSNYASQLAIEVLGLGLNFDAVVMPPSSRQDAAVYKAEILNRTTLTDLTGSFSGNHQVKSASSGTTLATLCAGLSHAPKGIEANINNLLIVDDSIRSGRTVEAILAHLHSAGLPQDCAVTIAVWAKIT